MPDIEGLTREEVRVSEERVCEIERECVCLCERKCECV